MDTFFGRLKWLFTGGIEQKEFGHKVLPWQDGTPQYLEDNYRDLAKGGFSKNELVYACITELSSSVPEAPMRIYSNEEEALNEHPFRLLMKRPNPWLTEFELWEMTVIYLMLSGNAYWEKVRNRSGQVVEIIPLRPDRVHIIPSEENYIEGYEYELGGRMYKIPEQDVIHFKLPDPLNDFLGMPPLRAGVRATSVDNEATDFVKSLLENKAIPGVVITTQSQIDEDLTKRLTKKWKQKFGGKNRGEPAFLQEGMDIKSVGLNMQELAFPDLRTISETRICAVFGVPPILVGAKTGLDRSTFSNYEEARKSFWQETIFPLLRRLADVVNLKLIPEFGAGNYEAKFDTTEVTALQIVENEKWGRADKAYNSGILKLNEARAEIGKDPVDDGDVFKSEHARMSMPPEMQTEMSNPPPAPNEQQEDEEDDEESNPEQRSRAPNIPALRLQKKEVKQAELDLLARAFGRIDFAEKYYDTFFRFARREFRKQGRDFMRKIEASRKAFDQDTLEELLVALTTLNRLWTTRIKADAYGTFEALIGAAMKEAGDEIGVAFELDNAAAIRFVEEYTFKFAKELSDTSQKTIQKTILKGQAENFTVQQIRDELTRQFTSWGVVRAEMVARSETIRASNQGALFTYQQSDVELVEWLASTDACPFCESLDGKQIATGTAFLELGSSLEVEGEPNPLTNTYETVQAPPLHPRCRCTIIPVIE